MMSDKADAILRQVRPKSWIKNLLVFSALIFSGEFKNLKSITLTILVFLGFCFLSSFFYIVNDWLDRYADSTHPVKQKRPLPDGLLTGKEALGLSIVMMIFSISFIYQLPESARFSVTIIFLAYSFLQILYNFILKSIFILDLFTIATGYVLRAVSGGVAIKVPLTIWFLLTIFIISVLVVSGKRRKDLGRFSDQRASGKHTAMKDYTISLLDKFIGISTGFAFITYFLYTISPSGGQRISSYGMPFSSLFVFFGLSRYLYLIYEKNKGGTPEELFLNDFPLQSSVLGWVSYILILFLK